MIDGWVVRLLRATLAILAFSVLTNLAGCERDAGHQPGGERNLHDSGNTNGNRDVDDVGDASVNTGVLEFRIAPFSPFSGPMDLPDLPDALTEDEHRVLVKWLHDNGPDAPVALPLPYVWVPLLETGDAPGLVVASFEGKRHLLVHDSDEFVIRSTDERPWGLLEVRASRGPDGLPTVDFRLDAEGARQMHRISSANIGRCMAIIVDGRAYSAPTIRAAIGNRGQITGIDKAEAERLARILPAGQSVVVKANK